jgi:predicted dehydrogenase
MGGWHARYARGAGARIVGIVDPDGARAGHLAARFPGARAFPDLAACLRETAPQVVHVCADTRRLELAGAALGAGAHVLVEKPVAWSRAEASLLLDTSSRQKRRVCPVHQFGFQAGFRRLLRERSALGDLVSVEARVASAGGEGRSAAARREVLLGMVPHYLSLARAIGGPVPAAGWRAAVSTEDDLELRGRVGGLPITISLSLRARPRANVLRVAGTLTTAHLDLYHGFVVFERGTISRVGKAQAPLRFAANLALAASRNLAVRWVRGEPAFPGLRELIASFHRSLLEGGPAPLEAAEILETAAVLEALGRDEAG